MQNVRSIYAASLLGLLVFCQFGQCETTAPVEELVRYDVADMGRQEAAGIDLYVKPKRDDPEPKPEPKVDKRRANPKAYPALYEKGREAGTIVVFGAEWCGWCKIQLADIPKNYRLLYVDKDLAAVAGGPKWRKLMTQWQVINVSVAGREVPSYPTTVMVVDGIPTKHWVGFKPFRVLEEHVQKAKTNEEIKPTRNNLERNGNRNRGPNNAWQPKRRIRRKPETIRRAIRRFIIGR